MNEAWYRLRMTLSVLHKGAPRVFASGPAVSIGLSFDRVGLTLNGEGSAVIDCVFNGLGRSFPYKAFLMFLGMFDRAVGWMVQR